MTARKPRRSDYEDDEEYDWCPTSAFWGSGSNYYIHHYPPETAGGRRPIGFTADIDTFVETWDKPPSTEKKERKKNAADTKGKQDNGSDAGGIRSKEG